MNTSRQVCHCGEYCDEHGVQHGHQPVPMPEPKMRIWHCQYGISGSWGFYQEYDCIVIAEMESKAIGMALMEYDDSKPDYWKAYEIDAEKESVTRVHEASS